MKTSTILLTIAGLASASAHTTHLAPRQFNFNDLLNGTLSNVNGALDLNFGDQSSLDGLEIGGVNLGRVDLGNQDVVAEAILAMLGGLCLGNSLSRNNILSFGSNNDVDLFFQLARLAQLQQLGFLDVGGIQSLFNAGQVRGGFNLGVFKRELSQAKKTMKRSKLRRGKAAKREQCVQDGVQEGGQEDGQNNAVNEGETINFASASLDTVTTTLAEEAGFTIATVIVDATTFVDEASTTEEAAVTATEASEGEEASETNSAAEATETTGAAEASETSATVEENAEASLTAEVIPAAAEATEVAAVEASPTAIAAIDTVAADSPAAAATAAAEENVGDAVDNLSDFTR